MSSLVKVWLERSLILIAIKHPHPQCGYQQLLAVLLSTAKCWFNTIDVRPLPLSNARGHKFMSKTTTLNLGCVLKCLNSCLKGVLSVYILGKTVNLWQIANNCFPATELVRSQEYCNVRNSGYGVSPYNLKNEKLCSQMLTVLATTSPQN